MFIKKFFVFLVSIIVFIPFVVSADTIEINQQDIQEHQPILLKDNFYKAKVIKVNSTKLIEEFGDTFIQQNVLVEFNSDNNTVEQSEVFYEYDQTQIQRKLKKGNKVILGAQKFENEIQYYINDVYRLNVLALVFLLFFLITLVIIKQQALRAIGSLLLSFVVIVQYLVPTILNGGSPFTTSLIAALGISIISLFWAHGINKRTTIAFISTIISVVLALVISYVFVHYSKLTGLGTEEAFFLQSLAIGKINLQGLLLGGIIIGTLGVLDDITTAQAATVQEIYRANNKLSQKQLYIRGLRVGREHIISLVNTLVLAYTSVSLPLFLLFSVSKQPAWVVFNSEIVVEEVIRMLVGSTVLILAVPITTAIAAYVFAHNKLSFIPDKEVEHGHHH